MIPPVVRKCRAQSLKMRFGEHQNITAICDTPIFCSTVDEKAKSFIIVIIINIIPGLGLAAELWKTNHKTNPKLLKSWTRSGGAPGITGSFLKRPQGKQGGRRQGGAFESCQTSEDGLALSNKNINLRAHFRLHSSQNWKIMISRGGSLWEFSEL